MIWVLVPGQLSHAKILSKRTSSLITGSLLARTKREGANSSIVHFAQVTIVLGSEDWQGSIDFQGHPGAGTSAYQVPSAELNPYHKTSESGSRFAEAESLQKTF